MRRAADQPGRGQRHRQLHLVPLPFPGSSCSVRGVRSTAGGPLRVDRQATTSSISATRKSPGRSANRTPASRSTAWMQVSRARSQIVSAARTVRPWAVTTGSDQASAGIVSIAADSRSAVSRTRSGRSARSAPDSISAARCSGEAYIGFSTPVRAQSSSRPSASAFDATWASRCRRLQPGSAHGRSSAASSRVSRAPSSSRVPSSAQVRAADAVAAVTPAPVRPRRPRCAARRARGSRCPGRRRRSGSGAARGRARRRPGCRSRSRRPGSG